MADRRNIEDPAWAEEDPLLQAGRSVMAACVMLCQALSVNLAELKLHSIESCTWPDASLGLPQPGAVYASAVTKGYVLCIRRASDVFTFHASTQGPPICVELLPPPAFDADHPLIADAMLDLAERLQVRLACISLEHVEMQEPSGPGGMRSEVMHRGETPRRLHVILRCGVQTYAYQGSLDGALTRRNQNHPSGNLLPLH